MNAIVPIIIVLGLGAMIRKFWVTSREFWRGLGWLSYWVFTPALFITSIGEADLHATQLGPFSISLIVPTLVVSGAVLATKRLIRADGPQLTSVMQGSVRINTYVGLMLASTFNGVDGVATFALACAIVVPLVNVICVATLAVFGNHAHTASKSRAWREITMNPLVIGCVIGISVNVSPWKLPDFAQHTIQLLSAPALVAGTLVAGASLTWHMRRRDFLDVGVSSVLKLVALPLCTLGIALPLGVSGVPLASLVIISAIPTAPSATVLATRLGGDTRLMATITGTQTLLALGSFPALFLIAEIWSK